MKARLFEKINDLLSVNLENVKLRNLVVVSISSANVHVTPPFESL
jgi:hypothetical protein